MTLYPELTAKDRLVMAKKGWEEEPIVAVLDFENQNLVTKHNTYPFRDLPGETLGYFQDQTTLEGIPLKRLPLTEKVLRVEKELHKEPLYDVVKDDLGLEDQEVNQPLDLLQQAFVYEMFLLTEIERRAGGALSKDQILEIASEQLNEMNGFVEPVDDIIEKYVEEQEASQELIL